MSKKHRVRVNKWLDGSLEVIEAWFENFEDALEHGRSHEAQSIKAVSYTHLTLPTIYSV